MTSRLFHLVVSESTNQRSRSTSSKPLKRISYRNIQEHISYQPIPTLNLLGRKKRRQGVWVRVPGKMPKNHTTGRYLNQTKHSPGFSAHLFFSYTSTIRLCPIALAGLQALSSFAAWWSGLSGFRRRLQGKGAYMVIRVWLASYVLCRLGR